MSKTDVPSRKIYLTMNIKNNWNSLHLGIVSEKSFGFKIQWKSIKLIKILKAQNEKEKTSLITTYALVHKK